MNLNLQEGVALAKELNDSLAAEKPNCDVIICTPFIHLATVSANINHDVIALGAENCADKEKGAYTGEVSAEMVKSTGAEYVILGHSERRGYYGETPEILKEKVLLALKNGLKVIFCIGESLEEQKGRLKLFWLYKKPRQRDWQKSKKFSWMMVLFVCAVWQHSLRVWCNLLSYFLRW